MNRKQRLVEYLLITSVVWIYYALVLPPTFFIPFFGWGTDEIIKWWIYGSPIEFVIAYPMGKILIKIAPRINKFIKRFE